MKTIKVKAKWLDVEEILLIDVPDNLTLSLTILNQFLDIKIGKGYPEYIGRSELNGFMKEYINLTKNEIL